MTDADDVPEVNPRHFAGVIRGSFFPEPFMDELQGTVLKHGSPVERVRRHLREAARSWMLTATRQTLGILSSQEVTPTSSDNAALDNGVCGRVLLNGSAVAVESTLGMAGICC
ncbi:MAG: hypothetical protein ABIT38_05975 [Gemmatimonadaceae bacterium]